MAKTTRIKSPAQLPAPQTREQAAEKIRELGDTRRELIRLAAAMNDEIAEITDHYKTLLAPLTDAEKLLAVGIQTYCEANRVALTDDGRVKSANLVTGSIQWRIRPPSCRITGEEAVISTLERLGLGRFVRVKKEVNKDAILNEKDVVAGVGGITIRSGIEDFVIEPFEQEAA